MIPLRSITITEQMAYLYIKMQRSGVLTLCENKAREHQRSSAATTIKSALINSDYR